MKLYGCYEHGSRTGHYIRIAGESATKMRRSPHWRRIPADAMSGDTSDMLEQRLQPPHAHQAKMLAELYPYSLLEIDVYPSGGIKAINVAKFD